jgi:hypothetical protein
MNDNSEKHMIDGRSINTRLKNCEFIYPDTGKRCDLTCNRKYCYLHWHKVPDVVVFSKFVESPCLICNNITRSPVSICRGHKKEYIKAYKYKYGKQNFHKAN